MNYAWITCFSLVFSGLLVITDKFIDRTDAEKIRREITMTKVGRLIYEDGLEEGRKAGREEERLIAIDNMLKLNIPEEQILKMYSQEELRAAKEAVKQDA